MARRRLARNTPEVLDPVVHLTGEISHETGTASPVSTAGRARVGDGVAQGGHPLALQRHETPWGVNSVVLGILPDGGVADQTAAVLGALIALAGAPTPLRIPPGVRFDVAAVKAGAPDGAMMEWMDTVNNGQPPGYSNLFWTLWRKDTQANDWLFVISSSNHPAIMLDNDGAAGSESADLRRVSIMQKVGKDGFNDPILGIIDTWYFDDAEEEFVRAIRLQSRGVEAMNLTVWAPGAAVALNSYVQAVNTGFIYKVTTGGVLAGPAPTHDAGTVANGTAQLLYVRAALNVDATLLQMRESGAFGVFSPDTIASITAGAAGRSLRLQVEAGADVISLRDMIRGQDMIKAAPGVGTQLAGFRSNSRQPVTGAVPVIGTSSIYLTQAAPTDVTGFGGIADLTSVEIDVFFGDGNTTLKHSGTLILDGAVDYTVPDGTV